MNVPNPASEGADRDDRAEADGLRKTRGGTAGPPASTARSVADAAVVGWNAVAEALVPIIGQSSVTALYRRCLVSVGMERPWLPPVNAADLPENDLTVLHACVARQTAMEASQACALLFVAFRDLLGSLIGPSLAELLLRPVSAFPTTGSAEQDTFP